MLFTCLIDFTSPALTSPMAVLEVAAEVEVRVVAEVPTGELLRSPGNGTVLPVWSSSKLLELKIKHGFH